MTTPTEDIRRRLLAGETLTAPQIADEYGVSASLFSVATAALRKDGARFRKVKLPGGVVATTLEHPAPDASLRHTWGAAPGVRKHHRGKLLPPADDPRLEEQRERDRERKRKYRERKRVAASSAPAALARAAVKVNGNGADHPVPVLGESVQVFLLALADDGRVNVGLRDGEHTWLTTVDGFSAR